ncbi:hypothetical protein [Nocardiopsis sp. Huas11]|uniref:hypothetical protein n=1 Tax=Nocardiopsis sp. Huas11 TaxID=2183912 RepID=UPI000EB4F7A4|nr:hypothetical protein [Nocardiopsis sp. Huas11]
MWIGVAAAGALLLVACAGLVVWSVAESRPYAALPSCGDLLPADLLDAVPDTDRPRVDGRFTGVDEVSLHEDTTANEGFRGSLDCVVSEGSGDHVLNVYVALYDAEVGLAGIENRREEIEDGILDLEEGRFGQDLPGQSFEVDVHGWTELSAGDGGYAVVADYTDGEWESGGSHAQAYFSSANAVVSVSHPQDGRVDEGEFLGFLERFAGQLDRQLSREGERV